LPPSRDLMQDKSLNPDRFRADSDRAFQAKVKEGLEMGKRADTRGGAVFNRFQKSFDRLVDKMDGRTRSGAVNSDYLVETSRNATGRVWTFGGSDEKKL